jgi:hypothetical protein
MDLYQFGAHIEMNRYGPRLSPGEFLHGTGHFRNDTIEAASQQMQRPCRAHGVRTG